MKQRIPTRLILEYIINVDSQEMCKNCLKSQCLCFILKHISNVILPLVVYKHMQLVV